MFLFRAIKYYCDYMSSSLSKMLLRFSPSSAATHSLSASASSSIWFGDKKNDTNFCDTSFFQSVYGVFIFANWVSKKVFAVLILNISQI